jgi:hypothetical protein
LRLKNFLVYYLCPICTGVKHPKIKQHFECIIAWDKKQNEIDQSIKRC